MAEAKSSQASRASDKPITCLGLPCPVLPMGPSPACLPHLSKEMLACKDSHVPVTQPQEPLWAQTSS